MKKIILLLLSFSILSCTNKEQKKLNGNWYNLNKKYTNKFKFKNDSLIIIDIDVHKAKYKIVNNYIEFDYKPRFEDVKTIQLNYQLNKNRDTLVVQSKKDSIPKNRFLKAKNYLDFLFKKNNVIIDLKTNQSADYVPLGSIVINIYIENIDGVFKGKTEFSENLESLDDDLEKIEVVFNEHLNRSYYNYSSEILRLSKRSTTLKIDNFKERWMKDYFQFQIFADKSVPQNEVDKIISIIKENYEFRIYQIYFTPENTYAPINDLKGIEK